MPIKSNSTLPNGDVLVLWEITEDYSFFKNKVTLTDEMWAKFDQISFPKRKTEWLVSKYIIQNHFNHKVELSYNDRKLCLTNSQYEVSISHNNTYCCVMISQKACGIDIENISRLSDKLAERFMSSKELYLANTQTLQCVVWTAKEALYKRINVDEIDFRKDFHIKTISDKDISIEYDNKVYTFNYFEINKCIVSYNTN